MKSHAWSFVAVLGITASSLSCVLLVDNSTNYGLTCHFAGEATSACGECVAKNCPTYVNACCGDPICAGNLGTLDTCAEAGACADLFADTDGGGEDAGIRSSLNQCITTSCASVCANDASSNADATAPSTAGASCSNTASNLECTCSAVASDANNNTCSAKSLGNGDTFCCGGDEWPKTGSCNCYEYTCIVDSGQPGCDCTFAGQGNDVEATYAPGAGCEEPTPDDPTTQTSGCCVSDTECYCAVVDLDDTLCESGFTTTDSCTISNVQCPKNGTHQSRCN